MSGCYRTTEWGATGEYRGQNTKTDVQQVGSAQTVTFDDKAGLRVTVVARDTCRPLMLGEHLEREEESTRELQGAGWMVGTGVGLTLIGIPLALLGANDQNTMDANGFPRTPYFSKGADYAMIVGGGAAALVGITELVLALTLPSSKHESRWVALPADTHRVFISDDVQPCSTPAQPVAGVAIHVEARFEKGEPLVWDVVTDPIGTAAIDLDRVRAIAGWCGQAHVTAKLGDQRWDGQIETAQKIPLDQITDEKARALATACGG